MIQFLKIFGLIYFISFAAMYYINAKARIPTLIPGDFYIKKGYRSLYFPISSSLVLAILLYLLFRYVASIFNPA